MAKLPSAVSLGPRPTPRVTRPLPRGDAGLGGIRRAARAEAQAATLEGAEALEVAQTFETFGRTFQSLSEIELAFERQQQAANLAAATSQGTAALQELQFNLESDQDFATHESRFTKGAEGIVDRIGARLDPAVRRAFQANFRESFLNVRFNVRRTARKQQIDSGNAQLVGDLDTYANLFATTKNELERQDIRDKVSLELANAVQTGLVTREDAVRREIDFRNRAEQSLANRMILDSPEAAEAALFDPAQFRDLTPETRVSLQARAQTRAESVRKERVRLAEKAERDADRARKQAQDARELELLVQALDPEQGLSESSVLAEGAERNVDAAAVSRLISAVRAEKEVEDDPNVTLNLSRDALANDPTIPSRVVQAMENQLISGETAIQIVGQHDQASRRGGILAREDVQRAREFVDANVGGLRGPLAILDSAGSARTARALREYDRLVTQADGNGKPFDPMEIADQVTSRYRLAPRDITELPRPLFLVGNRAQPDIEATRSATLEAMDNQEISRETAAEELKLLEEMETILSRRSER